MRSTIFILLLMLAQICVAQRASEPDSTAKGSMGRPKQMAPEVPYVALRFHNSMKYEMERTDGYPGPTYREDRALTILNPSLSVYWKKHSSHGFDLQFNNLHLQSRSLEDYAWDSVASEPVLTSESRVNSFGAGARFEVLLPIATAAGGSVEFLAGLGAQARMYYARTIPGLSTAFPLSQFYANQGVAVSGRMSYWFHPKWSFDLVLPFSIMNTTFTHTKVDNPAVEPAARSLSNFRFDLLPKAVELRFGFSLKL